jgi:hypothetical protein
MSRQHRVIDLSWRCCLAALFSTSSFVFKNTTYGSMISGFSFGSLMNCSVFYLHYKARVGLLFSIAGTKGFYVSC